MIIIYGTIFIFYIILFFISISQKKKKIYNREIAFGNPFGEMAAYVYRKLYSYNLFRSGKAQNHLEMLHPGTSSGEKKKQNNSCGSYADKFYIHKIGLVLLLVFIGNVFATGLCLSSRSKGILTDGKYIQRNTYGNGSIEAELQAEIEAGEKESGQEFHITVNERKYEKAVIERLAKETAALLPELMLKQNIAAEEVRSDLNLIQKIKGYPFKISWDSDNYELIYTDGTVNSELTEENGKVVSLTATLSYDNYKEEHVFAVRVCPLAYTEEELLKRKIYEVLGKQEELFKEEEYMELPAVVDGTSIRWKEKKEDNSGYFLLLMCIGGISAYFLKDKDLHKKAEQRNYQMLLDYPAVISKLTLYMGAGMTIRNAFYKAALNYKKEKEQSVLRERDIRYVYEEMLVTCHEINSGISETTAYENFGKRCRLPQYTKLSNILLQNLKKGSNSILAALRQEAVNAFEERKNTARKLGEEAGTKLLLPMMIMLGIVMVLIIIPAYFSFSM